MLKLVNAIQGWYYGKVAVRAKTHNRIGDLRNLYDSYWDLSGKPLKGRVFYELLTEYGFAVRSIPAFSAFFVSFLVCQWIGWRDGLCFATAFVLFGYVWILMRLIDYIRDYVRTNFDKDGDSYVTYWFASKEHLNQIRKEIARIKPLVEAEVSKTNVALNKLQNDVTRLERRVVKIGRDLASIEK